MNIGVGTEDLVIEKEDGLSLNWIRRQSVWSDMVIGRILLHPNIKSIRNLAGCNSNRGKEVLQ